MIEIIQDGQATPRIKLPRNLRQIGNPSGEHKIYVEDFVYTFLHPSSREEAGNPKVAIIVGTQEEEHGTQYYFVRGAFYIDDMTFEKGLPQFSEEHWGFAYKQMKEYFDTHCCCCKMMWSVKRIFMSMKRAVCGKKKAIIFFMSRIRKCRNTWCSIKRQKILQE